MSNNFQKKYSKTADLLKFSTASHRPAPVASFHTNINQETLIQNKLKLHFNDIESLTPSPHNLHFDTNHSLQVRSNYHRNPTIEYSN